MGFPIILQNFLNNLNDIDYVSDWSKDRKMDVTPTYNWFMRWINNPNFKKKLSNNINKYGISLKPYSKYSSDSLNVDDLILSMKNNAKWAKDNFRLHSGKYTYGMYTYDPYGEKSSVYINPAAIINPGNLDSKGTLVYGVPDVTRELTEEFGHSLEMRPLIEAVRRIYLQLKNKGKGYLNLGEFNDDLEYLEDPDELYQSLMRLRRDAKLNPGDKIDMKWIKNNQKHIDNNRLHYLPAETIIRLHNEVADNSSNNDLNLLFAKKGIKFISKRK